MAQINDVSELKTIIYENFPEYTLVRIEDNENSTGQSYKYLYEKLCVELEQCKKKIAELEAELFSQNTSLDMKERELARLAKQLDNAGAINEALEAGTSEFHSIVEKLLYGEIIISSLDPVTPDGKVIVKGNELRKGGMIEYTPLPAIYECKRPSFFSPLGPELNKENAAAKMAAKTSDLLKEKLMFWDKILQAKKKNQDIEKLADEVDLNRFHEINKLLGSKMSNEEKYIKYLMLTPGIKKDFLCTLTGAAELALDADVVIRLLEQPAECFNREVFEMYISQVHKGTEYNLKRELAEELIRDEWSVRATVNGKEQLFRLVPFDFLCELRDKLVAVENLFENNLEKAGDEKNFAAGQGPAGGEEISFEDDPQITMEDAMIW